MTDAHSFTPPKSDLAADRAAIAQAIDELGMAIGDARVRVEGGEGVDLAGLDEQVRVICAAIGLLPGAIGRAMLPQLVALTDGLNALEAVLKRHPHGPRAPRIDAAVTVPRRAAEAYGAAGRAK
jgi:hypothetical protein